MVIAKKLYGIQNYRLIILLIISSSLCIFIGIEAPPRDYDIPGTNIGKIFTTIGAAANLVFAFNTGMLPEIQVHKTVVYVFLFLEKILTLRKSHLCRPQ